MLCCVRVVCCCVVYGVGVEFFFLFVCAWFLLSCLTCASGAKEKDEDGRLPLHLSCADQAPVSVVSALLAAHPDGESAGLRRDA